MNSTNNSLYRMLIAFPIIGALLIGIVALRYSYSSSSAIESGAGLIVLLALAASLGLYRNRPSRYMNSAERNGVLFFGMILGLLWIVEISINNFIAPPLPGRDIVDNIFWAIIALSILAFSIIRAYQKDSLVHGIEVGMWNGLVSGLMACCMALTMIVFGMRFILQDPLNVSEWMGRGAGVTAPNMAAYFAFETLAGALGHLTLLGFIMGSLLGVMGGSVGKGIKSVFRMKRPS